MNGKTNKNGVKYVDGPDAFPQVPPDQQRHLLVQDIGTGRLGPWYPNTNGEMGQRLGPYAMATDGKSLWTGGEFTKVNQQPQQGIAWFRPGVDPTKGASPPVAVSVSPGSVTVYARPPLDADDPDQVVS